MLRILIDNRFTVWEKVLLFVFIATAMVFSIMLHEIAHGLVAHWNGDDTAKVNGRLSLNPLRHFDPIGGLMIIFVGFGYAKPVPVNPYNFRNYRKGCILVSIAGVTVNIIIGFLASGLSVLFTRLYASTFAVGWMLVGSFFGYLSLFNIYLCFFNLLPVFPLDGYNLIKGLCKRDNAFLRFMGRYGQYILLAIILVSIMVENFNVPFYFSPLDAYMHFTADYVSLGFDSLWGLIFGGI